MKRKLIKHGESSLTISLPRSFVRDNNLKKGQEIEVIESEEQLKLNIKVTKINIPQIKQILEKIVVVGEDLVKHLTQESFKQENSSK